MAILYRTYHMFLDSKIIPLGALLLASMFSYGQTGRELRGALNSQGFNDTYPAISGDGSVMAFTNDYSNDGSFITMISRKESGGRWNKPIELETLNPARLNAPGGYALSFDGNTLAYSTKKGEGVGGFDLWYMIYENGKWSNPRNFARPVNSTLNDSYPAFSPDGRKLFFTRCVTIGNEGGTDCKIYVSEKKRGRSRGWKEPVELDASINSGNSMMPRLLSDNKTLVFLSDRPGGKGGLDWYLSRLVENDGWSSPVNMSFVNTDQNDMYLTMYYRPDRAITSQLNNRGKLNVVEIEVPEQFQPAKVVIKIGKVLNDLGEVVDSDIRARDYNTGESVTFTFPDEETGDYTLIIPEGKVYDFSIVPKRGLEMYHSEILNYSSLRSSRKETADYVLHTPAGNAVLPLFSLKFAPQSAELDPRGEEEIARLVRLLKRNQDFSIEIGAYQDSVVTDSIPNPSLTEVITDTVRWEEFIYEYEYTYQYNIDEDSVKATFPEFTNMQLDSILTVWNDSLQTVQNDTLLADLFLASLVGVDTITNVIDTLEHVDVIYTYHNDLTKSRAEYLAMILASLEVDPARIVPIGYGDKRRPLTAIKEEDFQDGFIEIIFRR